MFSEFPSCAKHWAKGPKHVLSFSPQSHPLACPLGTLGWLAVLKWRASSHPENKWWGWGHTGSFCLLSSCYFHYATFLYKDESRGGEYCRNRQKRLICVQYPRSPVPSAMAPALFFKEDNDQENEQSVSFRFGSTPVFLQHLCHLGEDLFKNLVLTSFCLSTDCWGAQCFYRLFISMAIFCVL